MAKGAQGYLREEEHTRTRVAAHIVPNAPFCQILASVSNFKPRNTQCIPAVKILAF